MENRTGPFNARRIAIALALLAVAGCKPAAPAASGNATSDAVAATAPTPLAPGEWELTRTRAEVEQPFGTPHDPLPEATPSDDATPTPDRFCLTPVQAAAPPPELLIAMSRGGACERRSWSMINGSMDGEIVCPGQAEDIREVPVRLSGSYDRDSYRVTATMRALGIDFRQDVEAKRVGACHGD